MMKPVFGGNPPNNTPNKGGNGNGNGSGNNNVNNNKGVMMASMPAATPSTAAGSQLHMRRVGGGGGGGGVGNVGGEGMTVVHQQQGQGGQQQYQQQQQQQQQPQNQQQQFGMQFSPTTLDNFSYDRMEEEKEKMDGQRNVGQNHMIKAGEMEGEKQKEVKNGNGGMSSAMGNRDGSPLSVKPVMRQQSHQQQPSSYIIQELNGNNPIIRLRDLVDGLPTWAFLLLLAVLELAVAYPLIGKQDRCDFDCYMLFGNAVLAGERDYSNLECQLGPDYYPAGFTWLYAAIAYISNWNYVRAQLLGMAAYVMHHVVAAHLFTRYAKLPKHLLLICFPFLTNHAWHVTIPKVTNDVYPTLVIVVCMWAVLSDRLWLASLMYTSAVALKMNNLFYGPPLLIWYLLRMPLASVVKHFAFMGVFQIGVAAPFLMVAPIEYLRHAFNFSRDFTWSNNYAWKFLGKELATAPSFGLLLLACTVGTLGVFYYILMPTLKRGAARYKVAFDGTTASGNGGQQGRMRSSSIKQLSSTWMDSSIETEAIIALFLGSNLIGYAFSKGIHVQFILWISWTIPFLLYHTRVMGVSMILCICFIADEAYYTVLYDMLRIGRFDVNNSVLLALFHFGTLGLSLWHWFSVSRFQKLKMKEG
eukprot:TRINITY_DN1561_c1_g1_i5.p1 TRINITY_DN1561_c1_g1~~TRINITY_DN1561_c1_g1_i5.p1  ORF type:complete len:640 (+),score=178.08 TRINITY_DN1561_c1_g1_i5:79-1998(+)